MSRGFFAGAIWGSVIGFVTLALVSQLAGYRDVSPSGVVSEIAEAPATVPADAMPAETSDPQLPDDVARVDAPAQPRSEVSVEATTNETTPEETDQSVEEIAGVAPDASTTPGVLEAAPAPASVLPSLPSSGDTSDNAGSLGSASPARPSVEAQPEAPEAEIAANLPAPAPRVLPSVNRGTVRPGDATSPTIGSGENDIAAGGAPAPALPDAPEADAPNIATIDPVTPETGTDAAPIVIERRGGDTAETEAPAFTITTEMGPGGSRRIVVAPAPSTGNDAEDAPRIAAAPAPQPVQPDLPNQGRAPDVQDAPTPPGGASAPEIAARPADASAPEADATARAEPAPEPLEPAIGIAPDLVSVSPLQPAPPVLDAVARSGPLPADRRPPVSAPATVVLSRPGVLAAIATQAPSAPPPPPGPAPDVFADAVTQPGSPPAVSPPGQVPVPAAPGPLRTAAAAAPGIASAGPRPELDPAPPAPLPAPVEEAPEPAPQPEPLPRPEPEPEIAEVAPEAAPAEETPRIAGASPRVIAPDSGTVGDLARNVRVNRPAAGDATVTPAAAEAPSLPGTAQGTAPEPAPTEAATGGALARNAVAHDNADAVPLIAVILVDDRGGDVPLVDLAFPFSVAIPAALPGAPARAARYRAAGREVVLIPNLPPRATAGDVAQSMQINLTDFPEAVAMMEDPAAETSRDGLQQLVEIVSETGHGFVSFPRGLNTAQRMAEARGVPAALVARDLGNGEGPFGALARSLDQAGFRARQGDAAILSAKVHPNTLRALEEWAEDLNPAEVSLAPVSAALLSTLGS